MSKNIGLCVNHIYGNEVLCQQSNIIFYENISRPLLNLNVPILDMVEIACFDGTLVATSISTAHKVIKAPARNKLFYVRHIEWGREYYENLLPIYTQIKLVSNSEFIQKYLRNNFDIDTKIVREIEFGPNISL